MAAKTRELLDILRRHGSLAWSVKHDERGALLLAKAVALALRRDPQAPSEKEEEKTSASIVGQSTLGDANKATQISCRDAYDSLSEEGDIGIGGSGLEELRLQLAYEVLQGGILAHLHEASDKPHLEFLGGAARVSLQEVLLRGGFEEGARFRPSILKGLEVPQDISTLTTTETTPEAKRFRQQAGVLLDLLLELLRAPIRQTANLNDGGEKYRRESETSHIFTLLACTAFHTVDSEASSLPPWTDDNLAQKAEEILLLLGTSPLGRQTGAVTDVTKKQDKVNPKQILLKASEVVRRLYLKNLESLLSKLHPVLQTKADGADETSFQVSKEPPLGAATVAACQLSVILHSLKFPNLAPVISRVMPSLLTAVDHWSPPVKKQGLLAVSHVLDNATVAELSWFKDVLMDALCKCATGSDEEVWPAVLPTLIATTLRLGGKDPRDTWYSHVFLLLLRDMELHCSDVSRRLLWLCKVPPLVDALRLFIIAHFKRLMPLLLTWIRASDSETRSRTLDLLKLVVLNTWPRMTVHADRLTRELRDAFEEDTAGQEHEEARRKLKEVCELLQRCKNRPIDVHLIDQASEKQVQSLGS